MYDRLKSLGAGTSGFRDDGVPYTLVLKELLERFAWGHAGDDSSNLTVRIETEEFTCLCPVTGQPDYAGIKIQFIPREWCVESKSLKLYLASFRHVGMFHEHVTRAIGQALFTLLDPKYITVTGEFRPRGGIAFKPTWSRHEADAE